MTEPAEGLRTLVDVPPSPPEPVEELHRRLRVRRRRRTRRRVVLAGMATLLAAVAMVPLVDRSSDSAIQVVTEPEPPTGPTTSTTLALEFVAGQPVRTRADLPVPEGWETLFVQDDRRVVGTRPLSEADRALAVLARNDVAFTSFPADGVVVALGYDRLQAESGVEWDGTPIDHGPALALGPERVLPGGVRARKGDVPQSFLRIASYAGPSAPAARMREAEAMVAGIKLVRTGDPSVRPSPPPPGSTMGFARGPLPVPEQGLPEVARIDAGPARLVVLAGSDCAYLRSIDEGLPIVPPPPAHGGGCGARPASGVVERVGDVVMLMGGPGSPPSTAVIIRVGAGVRSVTARLVDGRSVPAVVGDDGWGVAAGEGRIATLTAFDAAGRRSSEAFVG